MDFFAGAKTFIGLAISMMGTLSMSFGWTWWAEIAPNVQELINQLLAFGGLAFATYGKIMAAMREKALAAKK